MKEKIDLKNEYRHLYAPSGKKPSIVEVPAFHFLMTDGRGDPNVLQEYRDAIATLFPFSYGLEFSVKKRRGIDYAVMPLEGQWWGTPKGQTRFTPEDKALWKWTLMMMQPEFVTRDLAEEIRGEIAKKKDPPGLEKVRFVRFEEGPAVQMLHIGPYDEEWRTVDTMHAFAEEEGYALRGRHHEIYLSDVRRCAPERLRTVLRHPVRKAT